MPRIDAMPRSFRFRHFCILNIFTLCLFQNLFPSQTLQFQKSPEWITLTNGRIIKCEVVELAPNYSMKVRLYNGQFTNYSMDEIERIEYRTPTSWITNFSKPILNAKPRFTSIESYGSSLDGKFIGTFNGIDLNKILYLGIGLDWIYTNRSLTGFPIYFESRIHVPWRVFRPFLYFTGGFILFPVNHAFVLAEDIRQNSFWGNYTNTTEPIYDQNALWFQFSFGIGFKLNFYKETGIILQYGVKSWQPIDRYYGRSKLGITSIEMKIGIGF